MPSVPETDDKTVHVAAPEPKAAAPATPEPKPAPDPDVIVRERLKADYGVEDPDEIKRWREKAQRADELEQLIQQRPQQFQPPPQRPQQPQFDLAQWQAYARVDPGGAFMQMRQMEAQQQAQREAHQMAFVESRIRAAQEFASAEAQAERYVKDEFPEAYNTSSKLHKEGQRVYSSMPALQQMGDGFAHATKIAAANLGLLPKSKRQPTLSEDDAAAQAPERGSRRPAAEDVDDSKPLTPRQKKMARDMGVSEKDYRTFQKARATGKNVKVS